MAHPHDLDLNVERRESDEQMDGRDFDAVLRAGNTVKLSLTPLTVQVRWLTVLSTSLTISRM